MAKALDHLTAHFEGSKRMAWLAITLFAIGIIIFIVNNTVLFFVNEEAYFWPRLGMKTMTDLCWFGGAMLGTRYYPTKRNMLLMPTLFFYVLGDIAVFFSVPVGGILYAFGHFFMIWAILETTYIRRWQKITYVITLLLPAILLPLYVDDVRVLIIGILYGAIVTAVMALSLSNRFFWLAGVVFTLSDLTGLLRLSLLDNKFTYVITTFIYFAAFFMLCISVYSIHRKEVVTMRDLFSMLKSAAKRGVRFWVAGSWALGLLKSDSRYAYEAIDLVYDGAKEEEFLGWLKRNRFEREYGKPGEAGRFYSEKYGSLRSYPAIFYPDGVAVMTSEKGHKLELDEGFFRDVRTFGGEIPCIVPGGRSLTRDIMNDEKYAGLNTPEKKRRIRRKKKAVEAAETPEGSGGEKDK